MTITATSSATATPTTDTVALGHDQLAQNFDTFLTLLTTQMKNQDPLSPLDSNQFTAQLVQMTGVEQQLATNDLLKQLVANSRTSLIDLIGKQVRADSADAQLSGGKAQWSYSLDSDTPDLKIEVLNSSGATVDVIAPTAADIKAGVHTFSWDGRNIAGAPQPDGTYTLRLTTKNATGDSVAVGSVYLDGAVTGVEQSNGDTLLTINGVKVPLNQLISVSQPPAPAATASSNATTSNPADQTSAPGV
jgi:flagellar basal-body rod modification protein FlgD